MNQNCAIKARKYDLNPKIRKLNTATKLHNQIKPFLMNKCKKVNNQPRNDGWISDTTQIFDCKPYVGGTENVTKNTFRPWKNSEI